MSTNAPRQHRLRFHINNPVFLLILLPVVGRYVTSQPAETPREIVYVIDEECDVGTTVGHLATDAELESRYPPDVLKTLRFRFLSPAPSYVGLDEVSGLLFVAGRIDRDVICRPDVEMCRIQEDVAVQPVQYFSIIKVSIEIRDRNDHSPVFTPDQIIQELAESSLPGSTSFVIPTARDPDSRPLSVQKYRLQQQQQHRRNSATAPEDDSEFFQLKVDEKLDGSTEVRLVLQKPLDRERRDLHRIVVLAVDGGSPALTGTVEVSVVVLDANDNSPTFDAGGRYEARVVENAPTSTVVTRVSAHDVDAERNGRVAYGFASSTRASYGNVFAIDNATEISKQYE